MRPASCLFNFRNTFYSHNYQRRTQAGNHHASMKKNANKIEMMVKTTL